MDRKTFDRAAETLPQLAPVVDTFVHIHTGKEMIGWVLMVFAENEDDNMIALASNVTAGEGITAMAHFIMAEANDKEEPIN
jgi:hypothetical protein